MVSIWNHFLLGMLAAALRRNTGNRTLQNLQKSLLHTLTGYIAGNGNIL